MSNRWKIFKAVIKVSIIVAYIIAVGILITQALTPKKESANISNQVGNKIDDIVTDIQKPEVTVVNVTEVKISSVTILSKKHTGESVDISLGNTGKINTSVSPKDASNKSLIFSSSDEEVVYVSADGKISAKAVGTATITVRSVENGELYDAVVLTVNKIGLKSISIGNIPNELRVGKKHKLEIKYNPTNTSYRDVIWSTSNSKVVTVDKSGTLTAKAEGTATITAKSKKHDKITSSVTIKVLPKQTTPVIPLEAIEITGHETAGYIGGEMTLKAKLLPSDAKETVIWSSSDESVATVTQKGVLSLLKAGTVDITAKCDDITATVTVTVKEVLTSAISLTVKNIKKSDDIYTIKEGKSGQVIATIDENATVMDLHFSSSDEEIARIGADGAIEALKEGEVTITVSSSYDGETVSTSFDLTIEPITIKDTVENFYYKVRKAFGHFGAFLALGVLAALSYYIIFPKTFKGKLISIAVCLAAGFAVAGITEILQLPIFTEGRTCSFDDVLLDFNGYCCSAIPIGIMILFMHLIKRFAGDSLLSYVTDPNELSDK